MVPFYHPRDEYDDATARLAAEVSAKREGWWVSFETLVPASEWGESISGQPDVFHFTERGHRLLGEAVDAFVEQHLWRELD